jgi:SSS family solute:Na+ symporter
MAYVCIDGFAALGPQKNALAEATIRFAPPIIAGLVLSAIVAATISSASGNMIGTATMFTNDIFRPYINKGITDDKKEVWISRLTMTIVGLVGLVIAIKASNIISVMMGAFALRSAGPFAAFICGLFYKNVTKRAGFISIVVGTFVAAIWIYALHTPWGLNAMVPGGLIAFAFIFAISAIERSMGIKPATLIEFEQE